MANDVWNKAVADAKKILGNGAVIPLGKMATVLKNNDDYGRLDAGFNAAREALEKKIREMEDAISKVDNSRKQAQAEILTDDYGLDSSDPDDKKKIADARAILKKFFDNLTQRIGVVVKGLDDLDEHVIEMRKYKGSQ